MSKTLDLWRQVGGCPDGLGVDGNGHTTESVLTEMHGALFHSGVNIGREVESKLKSKYKKEPSAEDPWPTLLQANGEDHGLTAGILTVVGIDPFSAEQGIRDIAGIVKSKFGYDMTFTEFDRQDQLPEGYEHYPEEQGWSLPAVYIEYITD